MNTEQTLAAVRRSVTVAAPIEKAFAVFTEFFGTWWPSDYQINPSGYETAFIEPRVGGRWFERAPDGSECDWGRVLTWDPPRLIRLAWQLNGDYEYEPDNESEVEITFTEEEGGRTRVDLVHSKFEGLTHSGRVAASISDDGGWSSILPRYAAAVAAA
jgi:uncharacterized protein YndB with AHSA1/START domain